MTVRLKRAYDLPAADDGERYLVERLWPRGVTKTEMALTGWLKDLAPSTELRRWYGHRQERWPEFAQRYQLELSAPEKQASLRTLAEKAREGNVTLILSTRLTDISGAAVLKEVLAHLASSPA